MNSLKSRKFSDGLEKKCGPVSWPVVSFIYKIVLNSIMRKENLSWGPSLLMGTGWMIWIAIVRPEFGYHSATGRGARTIRSRNLRSGTAKHVMVKSLSAQYPLKGWTIDPRCTTIRTLGLRISSHLEARANTGGTLD